MDDYTPITRPPHSQVTVDSNRRECPSDGFNYPTFRLLNKQTRVYLSRPFEINQYITYRPFAVANSKGWFAAIRNIENERDIILSPLAQLREAAETSESESGLFLPKRDLSMEYGLPTILAFAHNDTRLVVGLDQGHIFVYDTAKLFSPGDDPIAPLQRYTNETGALRQISPNPAVETDLADLIAIVRSDGKVQLLNTLLESRGGWAPADINTSPVTVSWSPKGKHLAIGLQTGDILTYALNNKSIPNKHIPPAFEGQLVAINWLAPGHTFRLSYAPQIANEGESVQQFVSLDIRSNVLTVFNALHPFVMTDRRQYSHALILPHFDETSATEPPKTLLVVGDEASVDLEILGGANGQWYQASQENPLSLPLNKNTEETTLLNLDVDLTDPKSSMPIMYAYLDDGSLQAWKIHHTQPYSKMMITASATLGVSNRSGSNDMIQDSAMNERESDDAQTSTTSTFNSSGTSEPQTSSPFGTTSSQSASVFGQTSTPAFGQPSAFGSLTPNTSSFGTGASVGRSSVFGSSSFGSTPGNAFSSFASISGSTNVFGQPSFGVSSAPSPSPVTNTTMTREASMSDGTTPSFGGLSLGGDGVASSNQNSKPSVFGSFESTPSISQPSTSAFGGVIKPATGFGAFNSTGSVFANAPSEQTKVVSAFSNTPTPSSGSGFGQSAFGKTGFGQQPAFGQSSFAQPSFGQTAFAKPSPAPVSAASTGGFAAFASVPATFTSQSKSNSNPLSAFASPGPSPFSTSTPRENQATSNSAVASNALNTGSTSTSVFGESGSSGSFTGAVPRTNAEPSSIVTSSPSLTKSPVTVLSPPSSPELPAPRAPDIISSTGTKKADPAPSTFGSSSILKPATGFGAFNNNQQSSAFFKTPEDKPTVTAFGGAGSPSAFKPLSSSSTAPAFGATSQLGAKTTSSAFGAPSQLGATKPAFGSFAPSTTPTKAPATGAFSAFSSSGSAFAALSSQDNSFSDLLKSSEKDKAKTPSTPTKSVFAAETTTPTRSPNINVSTTPKQPVPGSITSIATERTAQTGEESLSNISSSSVGGSFVDVSAEVERSGDEEEKDDDGDNDEMNSFLSSDFSSELDEAEEEEEEEDDDEGATPDKDKGKTVLGKSSSSTPQPEVPSIQITPSASPAEEREDAKTPQEESTTPPGSPEMESKSVSSKSPSPTPTTPSSYGIGLGRPSTRPARSSPLAAAPVLGDDEEEDGEIKSKPVTSPKPLAARLSPAREEPIKQEDSESSSIVENRPKTPPLLSAFGPLKATPLVPLAPKPELAVPGKAAFSLVPTGSTPSTPGGIFSKPLDSKTEIKRPATTPALTGNFDKPAQPSAPISSPATPTLASGTSPFSSPFTLGAKLEPSSGLSTLSSTAQLRTTSPTPTVNPAMTPGFLAPKPTTGFSTPQSSPFGRQGSGTTGFTSFANMKTASLFGKAPVTPKPVPVPVPEASLEEGMQKECASLVTSLEGELQELSDLAKKASAKRAELSKSRGGSRQKSDLGDANKWSLGDVILFGQMLLTFEKDLVELKTMKEVFKEALRELNSNLLKAHTRREEIARFNKAKTDKEFAKMLASRSLGPEHLETQQQLRRSIRAMRDRVQKLEANLQESKKKLSQAATGKPSIRAPTLDIINRTYRNIDIAIQQQTEEITRLSSRVANLTITPTTNLPSGGRDSRLPDQRPRSIAITPHVANTTAAALNAERSAHKLKNALLKARKEPILNKKAAMAPSPPTAFKTPHKETSTSSMFKGSEALFSAAEEAETSPPTMSWTLPEDNFSPGSPLPSSRRGAGSTAKKHNSVPLKKNSSTPVQSPPAPSFDWGPLPSFNNPPLTKLAAEVKPPASFVPLTATSSSAKSFVPLTAKPPTATSFVPLTATPSTPKSFVPLTAMPLTPTPINNAPTTSSPFGGNWSGFGEKS